MQDPTKFINFGSVSRHLSGSRSVITRKSIPKIHQKKVQDLIDFVDAWMKSDV